MCNVLVFCLWVLFQKKCRVQTFLDCRWSFYCPARALRWCLQSEVWTSCPRKCVIKAEGKTVHVRLLLISGPCTKLRLCTQVQNSTTTTHRFPAVSDVPAERQLKRRKQEKACTFMYKFASKCGTSVSSLRTGQTTALLTKYRTGCCHHYGENSFTGMR